ncbi:MAG TPA: GAF domain-containing protein [Dehalococcoidia bacterium]|nr:GAF domain-containing protein [Dehalococcoidia bacterium]
MSAPSQSPPQDAAAWLAALNRVMARVSAHADSESGPAALATGLLEEFGVEVARIYSYDPGDDALLLRARASQRFPRTSFPDRVPLDTVEAPIVRAVRAREPLILDPIREGDVLQNRELFARAGLISYAGFPLAVGGRLVGAMSMFLSTPWPPAMLDAVRVLAQQAALALDHTRLIEETHALQGIAADLATSRETETLMNELVERAAAVFGADASAVWMFDDRGNFRTRASRGLPAPLLRLLEVNTPPAHAFFEQIRRNDRPQFFADYPAVLERADPKIGRAVTESGIRSALRLPLFEAGGSVHGVLTLYHHRVRSYSASEMQLAQAFADQISVAIHNTTLAEHEAAARAAATRQLDRLTTLAGIGEQLLATSDADAVLRVVAEAAVRLSGAGAAVVALVQPPDNRLVTAAVHGEFQTWFASLGEPVVDDAFFAETVTGRAFRRGEAVLVDDFAALPLPRANQSRMAAAGVRAFVAAPLRKAGVPLGVLLAADAAPGRFGAEDAALLQALADQAALALEQARLIEESHALQLVAAELATTRDTPALLQEIVRRSRAVLGADAAAVWLLDPVEEQVLCGASDGLQPELIRAFEVMEEKSSATYAALRRARRPLHMRNVSQELRPRWSGLAGLMEQEGIVSTLRLPLLAAGGEILGLLMLYHRRERIYGENEIRLAEAFADQTAVAIYNAHLAEQERRARETAARQIERLGALAGITERMLASTDTDEVLRIVADAGWRLCDAAGAMVGLMDEQRQRLIPLATTGEPRALFDAAAVATLNEEFYEGTATGRALASGQAVRVDDYSLWPTPSQSQRETVAAGVRALIAAPLRLEGTPIGILWVNDTRPRSFADGDVRLIQALADQAALAVERARLLRRGQEASALEERARLARDLHDSVTQSVFSLGMLTRAAQAQHEKGSARLSSTLERIGTLAEEAQREMRALLVQLRPPGLDEGLVVALERLVDSFRLRSDSSFEFSAERGCRLAPAAEAAVFRIVQEALGNAVKHAGAGTIEVDLTAMNGMLTIEVRDDGEGFDPASPPASGPGRGGIGMRSMRERAVEVGALLRIESAPGAGTAVIVEVPTA